MTNAAGEDQRLLDIVLDAFRDTKPARIGIAVSGGGDSMALLHLMHRAASVAGWEVHAVTVDHGLRPASADEAAGVAGFCAQRGIPHTTLRWQGPADSGNLMDQARQARLALMADWARERGITDVLLGHTANDQAETFLMNLARAAGLDGLSGMRRVWVEHGIHWRRPLLELGRETLRAYLQRNGVGWIDDPSNDNDRFTRVKARRAMQALKPLGVTVDQLLGSIHNLAQARSALTFAVAQAAEDLVESRAGALFVQVQGLGALPPEIRRRLLISAIRWISGAPYPPRAQALTNLERALTETRDATLGGVRFRQKGPQIQITREGRAAMGPVPTDQPWDHRWQLTGPHAPGLEIRALGASGLRSIKDWRDSGIPREALLVSPAIWQEQRLIAAPLAGISQGWQAKISPSYTLFILSH